MSLPLGLLDEECRRVFTSDPPQVAPWTLGGHPRCPFLLAPVEQGPPQTAYLVPGYPNTRSRAQDPFKDRTHGSGEIRKRRRRRAPRLEGYSRKAPEPPP